MPSPRLRSHRAALALLLEAAAAACSSTSADVASTVRDSAGIQIVESTSPAWKEGQGRTVSAEPAVDIGETEGEAPYQLNQVAGALRLADGRIVVADGGSSELRLFDASGRHLASVGGQGGGPGEFRRLRSLHRSPGDSLLAFDGARSRLSVFAPDGRFVRSTRLVVDTGQYVLPALQGRLADGSLLVAGERGYPGEGRSEVLRDSVSLVRLDAAGATSRPAGRFPWKEIFIHTDGDAATIGPLAFGRTTEVAVDGDGYWVGTGDRYEVARYSADGTLRRLVRRPVPSLPVTSADIDAYPQLMRAELRNPAFAPVFQRRVAAMPFPKVMPAYAGLMADREGRLWVREFRKPAEQAAGERWTVFDPEGRMLGSVETPSGLRVVEIGADYVLGIWKDEDDVEHIRLHRLVKPATS